MLDILKLMPDYDIALAIPLRATCRELHASIMSRAVVGEHKLYDLIAGNDIISLLDWITRMLRDGPSGVAQVLKYAMTWIGLPEYTDFMRKCFEATLFMHNVSCLILDLSSTNGELVHAYYRYVWRAGVELDEPRMFAMLPDGDEHFNKMPEVCYMKNLPQIYKREYNVFDGEDDEEVDENVMYRIRCIDRDYDAWENHSVCKHGCVNVAKSIIADRPHLGTLEMFNEHGISSEFTRLCLE